MTPTTVDCEENTKLFNFILYLDKFAADMLHWLNFVKGIFHTVLKS